MLNIVCHVVRRAQRGPEHVFNSCFASCIGSSSLLVHWLLEVTEDSITISVEKTLSQLSEETLGSALGIVVKVLQKPVFKSLHHCALAIKDYRCQVLALLVRDDFN